MKFSEIFKTKALKTWNFWNFHENLSKMYEMMKMHNATQNYRGKCFEVCEKLGKKCLQLKMHEGGPSAQWKGQWQGFKFSRKYIKKEIWPQNFWENIEKYWENIEKILREKIGENKRKYWLSWRKCDKYEYFLRVNIEILSFFFLSEYFPF